MLREGDLVYLLDERGKRFWMQLEPGMVKLPGLGVVNGSRLITSRSTPQSGQTTISPCTMPSSSISASHSGQFADFGLVMVTSL